MKLEPAFYCDSCGPIDAVPTEIKPDIQNKIHVPCCATCYDDYRYTQSYVRGLEHQVMTLEQELEDAKNELS